MDSDSMLTATNTPENRESTPLLKKSSATAKPTEPSWHDAAVCGLAYTLATLFVLSPLRTVFGSTGSKHTVATTAVWFHPVRTLGNLIEVLYYTMRLLVLALSACLGATATIQLSYLVHLPRPAITAMLICWLSGTLGFIGVLKVRANNQSFNTASSAAIIFVVSVLVREDDAQKGALSLETILNYLKMVVTGAVISSTTSVLFYRKTSLQLLRAKCDELARTYADMLDLIVAQFGDEPDSQVVSTNTTANIMLAELNQHAKYASYEQAVASWLAWIPCRSQSSHHESKIEFNKSKQEIESLSRQSMHLGGMMHCASVVFGLKGAEQSSLRDLRKTMRKFANEVALFVRNSGRRWHPEDAVHIKECLVQYTHARDSVLRTYQLEMNNSLHATSILFADLLQDVGEEMTRPINSGQVSPQDETTQEDERSSLNTLLMPTNYEAEDADLQQLEQPQQPQQPQQPSRQQASEQQQQQEQQYQCRTSQEYIQPRQQQRQASSSGQFEQLNAALFPTRKTAQTGLGPRLWKLLRFLRDLDVRHGIRVALGAMVISLPACIPAYRPLFQKWHGEWTLITFMIIMARNLGAMTHNIPLRIIGTSIGAIIGICASELCNGNAVLLFFIGAIVSLGCYRRILSKKDPVFGRFILLSYNLVCLYGYSLSMDDPDDSYYDIRDPIYDVAFHRVISVCVGVLWAVFITVTIWPHSARQALRSELCIQWMRMGMAWKSDPLGVVPLSHGNYYENSHRDHSSNHPGNHSPNCSDSVRFRGIPSVKELQSMMLDLDTLLKNSPNEFRLRGKFDPAPYKQMIDSTQIILDAFHSISILIEDEPIATARERDLVLYTQVERRELSHLLFLQFYTASTSVRLGFPVPDYHPDISHPLTRLSSKVHERRLKMGAPIPSGPLSQDNYDFVLFYSYMTVLLTVSAELKRIHEALRALFGSLDDDILFSYV